MSSMPTPSETAQPSTAEREPLSGTDTARQSISFKDA